MNGTIYVIKNLVNGKVYVGQTTQDVNQRFKQHLKLPKSCKGQAIYKAIKKNGKANFFFEVIEEGIGDYHLLNRQEELYIKKFNSLSPNGYNLCPGGQMWRRQPSFNEKSQEKIIKFYERGLSSRFIASKMGCSYKTILDLLKRKGILVRAKTYKLPDRTSKLTREELKKMCDQGLSSSRISSIVKIDASSIRRAIRKFGLREQKSHQEI